MQPTLIQVQEFRAKLPHYLALAGKGQPLRIRSCNKVIAEVTGVALALSAGGISLGQVVDDRG